jgi:hypothetical protein
VVDVGETLIVNPVPAGAPPHDPVNQSIVSLGPEDPLSVAALPTQIDCEAPTSGDPTDVVTTTVADTHVDTPHWASQRA